MADAAPGRLSWPQTFGLLIFIFLCGFPALELTGFGFGVPVSLLGALAAATLGGALGGALMCHRPIMAGVIGGLVAGPLGLLALYYYTFSREEVYNVELVLVQGVACLPGLGLGIWLKKILSHDAPDDAMA